MTDKEHICFLKGRLSGYYALQYVITDHHKPSVLKLVQDDEYEIKVIQARIDHLNDVIGNGT